VHQREVQSWTKEARRARQLLSAVRDGEREATLGTLAGTRNANTLRRWIACLAFVDDLRTRSTTLASLLMRAPVSVVELFARWHSFDPEGARSEMREWADRGGSVRLVSARMSDARREHKALPARSIEIEYRKRMKDSIKRLVMRKVGGTLTEPVLNFKDPQLPPADYIFHSINSSTRSRVSVAVVVVGPFSSPDMYKRRLYESVAKAFAFAWVYDRVMLILPEKGALSVYQASIERFAARAAAAAPARAPAVEVVHLSSNRGDESYRSPANVSNT
jgi:hypothetical protein